MKRAADAQAIYRRAYELTPTDTKLEQKIASAQTQRREFLETCQSATGQVALQACQWALLPGSDDEFAIRKRTGVLLQAANQPAAALDSYVAASLLKRGDRSVALAIVALSAGSGRNDALTLAARGSALLTLGRALEALTPLKQAVALSPDLPEARAQLAQAERLAQVEARRKLLADAQPPAVAATAQTTSTRHYSNVAPNNRSN